jgi:hypothetical protein
MPRALSVCAARGDAVSIKHDIARRGKAPTAAKLPGPPASVGPWAIDIPSWTHGGNHAWPEGFRAGDMAEAVSVEAWAPQLHSEPPIEKAPHEAGRKSSFDSHRMLVGDSLSVVFPTDEPELPAHLIVCLAASASGIPPLRPQRTREPGNDDSRASRLHPHRCDHARTRLD